MFLQGSAEVGRLRKEGGIHMGNILPFKNTFPKLEEDVYIAPNAWIIGDVVIGKRSSIWFNAVVRGDEHYIRIGSETNVQDSAVLHGTPLEFPLEIGDRVTIGHGAILHGCVIEDECMIGMGAIVMDGSKIARGSLIAAGSLVTQGLIVPPGSLVMGTPGKIVKTLSEEEQGRMLRSVTNYLTLVSDYLDASAYPDAKKVKGFLG
jgi:carbonic anhydrase/acetyltransferase-like protein (isoleucine patch superfamily)